jgi:hypothetical protein
MAGYAKTIQINLGVTEVAELLGELCRNPRCDKDPDSIFLSIDCEVQPARRKPPVRKTSLNA